jgi:hypothetical protein
MTSATLPRAGTTVRLLRYLAVQFPPLPMLATAAALFLSVFLGAQALAGVRPLRLGAEVPVGIISTLLWTLLVRVRDDLTDVAADCALAAAGDPRYRNRPTVTGAVRTDDLRRLARGALAVLIGLNAMWGVSPMLVACAVGWGVTWMGFHWFFVPRWARRPGPFAYLARKGLTMFVALYAAAAVVQVAGWVLSPRAIPLLLSPCMGVAAWEVGRKIRLPADETAYPTYSSVLGWRRAALLAAGFVLASFILLWPTARAAGAGYGYCAALALAAALAVVACLRLLVVPSRRHCRLAPWMQLYGAVAHGGLAIALLLQPGSTLS